MTETNKIVPEPHTAEQPGLRGHSFNPDDNLLKRYLVSKRIFDPDDPEVTKGWLAVHSADTIAGCVGWINNNDDDPTTTYQIRDQFNTIPEH